MVYEGVIKGRFVELKSITLDDVQFSFDIRSAPENRETVGVVAKSVEEQKKYIEWQIKEPDDYYFVIYNRKGEKIGLIGLYDIQGNTAEMGREVCSGNCVEVIESEILVEDFAMDILGIKTLHSVIYANNAKHLKNQKHNEQKPHRTEIRNGIECYYFVTELTKDSPKRRKLAKIGDDFI